MKKTSRRRTNNSSPALLKPDSCFLIKSKQPLSELLPRYLTPGETLNQLAALGSDRAVGGHGGRRGVTFTRPAGRERETAASHVERPKRGDTGV